jgi:hypothetical protein
MMCKADNGSICLPGSEIPNWFSHQADEGVSLCLSGSEIQFGLDIRWNRYSHDQTMASLISFHVPSFWDGKIGKMLLCVVFAANKEAPRDLSRMGSFNWRLRNKTRTHQVNLTIGSTPYRLFGSCEDHIFVQVEVDHPLLGFEMKSGDEIELSVALYVHIDGPE